MPGTLVAGAVDVRGGGTEMEEGNLPGMDPGFTVGGAEVAGVGFAVGLTVEARVVTEEAAAERVVTVAGGLDTGAALAFLAAGAAPPSCVTVRFTA